MIINNLQINAKNIIQIICVLNLLLYIMYHNNNKTNFLTLWKQ